MQVYAIIMIADIINRSKIIWVKGLIAISLISQNHYSLFILARNWNYFASKILIACGGQTPSHARQKIQSGSFDINGFWSDAGFPGVSNHS